MTGLAVSVKEFNMADTSPDVRKSGSFDLVEKEITQTIERAEIGLNRFQEDRESGEDLQNCVDCLNQLRGIFTLIELQGGSILCHETVAVANEVPVGASDEKNYLLSALNQALFLLNRYVEYFDRRREDHPELLLDIINTLRSVRSVAQLPDSHFYPISLRHSSLTRNRAEVDPQVFMLRVRRMRHMYQVGLVNLLKRTGSAREVGLRLISRSATGFGRICAGAALASLWNLTAVAASLMVTQHYEVRRSRQQLFMRVERYAREMQKLGPMATARSAADPILCDLLYLLALAPHPDEQTRALLGDHGGKPLTFNEHHRLAHYRYLMGPGADVLAALARALSEELSILKDRIDALSRGAGQTASPDGVVVDPEENMASLKAELYRLAGTFDMLGLQNTSRVASDIALELESVPAGEFKGAAGNMMAMAQRLLAIEQVVDNLETEGLTGRIGEPETDSTEMGDPRDYTARAIRAVTVEIRSLIAQAKRAITAYLESGEDPLHLAPVGQALAEVAGALEMIEEHRAGGAVSSVRSFVAQRLGHRGPALPEHMLDTLADALTSLEYFAEGLARDSVGDEDLVSLAEESMKALGFPETQRMS